MPRRTRAWWPVLPFAILLGLVVVGSGRSDLVVTAWRSIAGPDQVRFLETALGGLGAVTRGGDRIMCTSPIIIDGDTLHCGRHRIRLAGIDAPEMPGHCRPGRDCTPGDPFAAKAYLRSIARGAVSCRQTDTDVYGRTVARCEAGGRDLSCAMIAAGHAVRRYGYISCSF